LGDFLIREQRKNTSSFRACACGRARATGKVLGAARRNEHGESDDVVNYCFPKTWPNDRELRARIIGEWLTTEASYLAS
jgi:hypothetical protein